MQAPPPAPAFTSTPGTVAAEGMLYTYPISATDPLGKSVTFTLGAVPAGTALSGNTLTWTPASAQSRLANSFSVTATTTEGGTATQTWSVTPAGTVHISRVITNWTATGSTAIPFDWTKNPAAAAKVTALIPQNDGSFQVLTGTGNADGTFAIPNVPGGYYWLRMSPLYTYWTSTSNFDWGADVIDENRAVAPAISTTIFDVNVNGLDPWKSGDFLALNLDDGFVLDALGVDPPGATSANFQVRFSSNIDLSAVKSAVVSQSEAVQLGSLPASVLGPTLQLSNLSITNGGTFNVSGTLTPSPKSSLSLDVQGTDWANLYTNAGPAVPTPYGTSMTLLAQPYFTGGIASDDIPYLSPVPPLLVTDTLLFPVFTFAVPDVPCGNAPLISLPGSTPSPIGQPPIVTDQNLGSVQYGDPFPQPWLRPFYFCQQATVTIPDSSSASPVTFVLGNGQITGIPSAPIAPLISAVQNPTLNGQSLFSASTLSTGTLNLAWSAPAINPSPTGYEVQIYLKTTITLPPTAQPPVTITGYLPTARIFTTKTSMVVPYPLTAGQNFLVGISALSDGRANFESSPQRSGMPYTFANVVSAVMTVSSSAPAAKSNVDLQLKPSPYVAPSPNPLRPKSVVISPHH